MHEIDINTHKYTKKKKWLIIDTYKPSRQNDSLFLENLSNNLSTYLRDYDNVLLLGDINMILENTISNILQILSI